MLELLFVTCLAGCPFVFDSPKLEWTTDIAMGYRLDDYGTDRVVTAPCERIMIVDPEPLRGILDDCGGNEIVYSGFPIAANWDCGKYARCKAGLYHYSSWFDGQNSFLGQLESGLNADTEISFNCLCFTYSWNWTKYYRAH